MLWSSTRPHGRYAVCDEGYRQQSTPVVAGQWGAGARLRAVLTHGESLMLGLTSATVVMAPSRGVGACVLYLGLPTCAEA